MDIVNLSEDPEGLYLVGLSPNQRGSNFSLAESPNQGEGQVLVKISAAWLWLCIGGLKTFPKDIFVWKEKVNNFIDSSV